MLTIKKLKKLHSKKKSIKSIQYTNLPLVYRISTRPCKPTKICGTINTTRTVRLLIASKANTCNSDENPKPAEIQTNIYKKNMRSQTRKLKSKEKHANEY